MNCTQCGASLEPGQRFCINCGAPVENAPIPRDSKPNIDLSDYFDDAPGGSQRSSRPQPTGARPVKAARPQSRPQSGKKKVSGGKSDRGLNIALLICGMLVIAVLVFALFLWLWPRNTETPAGPSVSTVPQVTAEPQNVIVPTPDAGQPNLITPEPATPSDTPIVIVTPIPPTAPPATPVIPSTPQPTPGAVAIVTPSPTPGPDYLLPGSDSHYLTEADLSGLSHEQLCFARNEIFARHGRIFKTPQIAAYFNSKSWYHGTISPDKFDESVLNKYEWANVNFIREYENKYYGGSYY